MMMKRTTTLVFQNNLFQRHNYFRFSTVRQAPFRFLEWYGSKLDSHPLLTKGISSGIINGTADGICQYITNKDEKFTFDWLRAGRFVFLGTVFVAPVTHVWYGLLSTKLFPGPSTVQRVTKRVVVDQFGFAPLFLPGFMGSLWMLEGRENIPQTLIEVTPEIVVANWSVWIPAMTINFSLVPQKFQVLYSNLIALMFTVYLSYKSEESKQADE